MRGETKYTLKWLFFGFSGRIRRSTYAWSAVLIVALYSYVVIQIVKTPATSWQFSAWGLVLLLMLFVTAWSSLALSFKRIQDIGFPGVLAVAMFIPMASFLCFLVLCFWPGEYGTNRFGRSPINGRK